ncbi:hypothetical protein DRQ33_00655 [bacterium]|nr:MAG: hypothetical protein DRQ33_00655 [bacterium]
MSYAIDNNLCVSCWGCIQICPSGAIVQDSRSAVIIPEHCTDCAECELACPRGAIYHTDNSIIDEDISAFIKDNTPQERLHFDIVILGGGPAGLSAGYYASKAGFSVAILERRERFGYPVACAEGISTIGLNRVIHPQPNWISSTIQKIKLFAPGGKMILVNHPEAGYILDRPAMETGLAEILANQGVKIFGQTTVRKICGENLVSSVLAQKNTNIIELTGKYFIGADGVGGISTRWAYPGISLKMGDYHSCAQVLLKSDEITDEPITEFWWGKNVAPGGYAWVFPKGGNRANVGLGIIPSMAEDGNAKHYLDKFLHNRLNDFSVIQRRDGIVPATFRLSPLGKANLLLVGDSARLPNAISGGGLDCALLSGKLAAESIAKFFYSNNEKILREYETNWKSATGKWLDIYAKLRKGVINLTDDELDKIAELLEKKLANKTWYGLDIPAVVWEIVKSSPKLLTIAGKFFINYL